MFKPLRKCTEPQLFHFLTLLTPPKINCCFMQMVFFVLTLRWLNWIYTPDICKCCRICTFGICKCCTIYTIDIRKCCSLYAPGICKCSGVCKCYSVYIYIYIYISGVCKCYRLYKPSICKCYRIYIREQMKFEMKFVYCVQ
jgi:hypothetical protein